jgi:hypothetical protein
MKKTPPADLTKDKPQLKLPGQFQNVPIIVSLYQFYSSFHDELMRFPKSERYSLGASCQAEMLDIIKRCLRAASSSEHAKKRMYLEQASANLDVLRLLLSLCKDCRCISNQTYQQLDSKLSEIGLMLGGWLKSLAV